MGAWIETDMSIFFLKGKLVAPRVGAWIETDLESTNEDLAESHPVWVRGLKHHFVVKVCYHCMSHPVWVRGLKHQLKNTLWQSRMSHPVWVRGLKLVRKPMIPCADSSHPVWVRGLKHRSSQYGPIRIGCIPYE